MADSEIRAAYDRWAGQYDRDENPTRDLNAKVLREQDVVGGGDDVLELGCGTGLNTRWLAEVAGAVVATDFSEGMLEEARQHLSGGEVTLREMDVRAPWPMEDNHFDCVVATLLLEHVEDLDHVFQEAHRVLRPGGILYLSELHPYRQRGGTQANFREEGTGEVVSIPAHMHSVPEFINGGIAAGFSIYNMEEWYGPDDEEPRLVSIVFAC